MFGLWNGIYCTLSCGHFNKHIAAYIIRMMIDWWIRHEICGFSIGFSQQSNFHLRQAQGRTNALVHIHHDLVEWDLSQVHSDPPSGYDIHSSPWLSHGP